MTLQHRTKAVPLSRCLLSHFKQIPVVRFHKLAFLCDYAHKDEHGEPISSVPYRRVLNGCFSESLQEAAESLEPVEIEEISIKGESIEVFSVEQALECGVKGDEQETIETVVKDYGAVSEDDINRKLRSVFDELDVRFDEEIRLCAEQMTASPSVS